MVIDGLAATVRSAFREAPRFLGRRLGQTVGAVEGGRAAGEAAEQVVELGPEPRVVADGVVGGLELLERRDERLGHVPATEVALHPPPARAIDLEQARVHGRGAERDVGPVPAGVPGALGEQGDAERVLARTLPVDPRRIGARGDVHAGRRDREQRVGDVAGMQAAGQRHRDLARDRGGDRRLDAHARPARVLAAGRVEQIRSAPASSNSRPRAIATSGSSPPPTAGAPSRRAARPDRRLTRLVARQLDGVRVDGGNDGAIRSGRDPP